MNFKEDDNKIRNELNKALKENEELLKKYIYRQCRQKNWVEDILQKVYLYIWEHHQEWNPNTPVLKWAYKIAYFTVKSHYRDFGREPIMLSQKALEMVAQEEENNESQSLLNQLGICLKKMKNEQRELLRDRYWNEISVNDMAAQRGKKPNDISQKMRRLRILLKECLQKQELSNA